GARTRVPAERAEDRFAASGEGELAARHRRAHDRFGRDNAPLAEPGEEREASGLARPGNRDLHDAALVGPLEVGAGHDTQALEERLDRADAGLAVVVAADNDDVRACVT